MLNLVLADHDFYYSEGNLYLETDEDVWMNGVWLQKWADGSYFELDVVAECACMRLCGALESELV